MPRNVFKYKVDGDFSTPVTFLPVQEQNPSVSIIEDSHLQGSEGNGCGIGLRKPIPSGWA